MNDFYIEIIEESVIENEEVTARIKIGDFEESFTLSLRFSGIKDYLVQWYKSLNDLLKSQNAVALMQWLVPGSEKVFRRGWIFYKIADRVYIQDRLFPTDLDEILFDEKGIPLSIPKRELVTEEGDTISEWETNLADIYFFLENVNAI